VTTPSSSRCARHASTTAIYTGVSTSTATACAAPPARPLRGPVRTSDQESGDRLEPASADGHGTCSRPLTWSGPPANVASTCPRAGVPSCHPATITAVDGHPPRSAMSGSPQRPHEVKTVNSQVAKAAGEKARHRSAPAPSAAQSHEQEPTSGGATSGGQKARPLPRWSQPSQAPPGGRRNSAGPAGPIRCFVAQPR
jgi:hypothetical protein